MHVLRAIPSLGTLLSSHSHRAVREHRFPSPPKKRRCFVRTTIEPPHKANWPPYLPIQSREDAPDSIRRPSFPPKYFPPDLPTGLTLPDATWAPSRNPIRYNETSRAPC